MANLATFISPLNAFAKIIEAFNFKAHPDEKHAPELIYEVESTWSTCFNDSTGSHSASVQLLQQQPAESVVEKKRAMVTITATFGWNMYCPSEHRPNLWAHIKPSKSELWLRSVRNWSQRTAECCNSIARAVTSK